MSYETVLLPKFFPDGTIILAKEQFHNSYTFWAIPILIFSPVQIIMTHPLILVLILVANLGRKKCFYWMLHIISALKIEISQPQTLLWKWSRRIHNRWIPEENKGHRRITYLLPQSAKIVSFRVNSKLNHPKMYHPKWQKFESLRSFNFLQCMLRFWV